ncbi:hypothetical protein BL1347_11100 [Bifidobacterium longum subsp. infantis]|uniref:hypothetical protein n=1 Tax=Bifidobacterium longum TaxID=216816 RepID=UPI001879791B|nr:hypothetical protein [Bifidobacterium longum]QOL44309.1 hypothetical protein BL1347_11100 [Bifidobacterium longum subsp. infantis]
MNKIKNLIYQAIAIALLVAGGWFIYKTAAFIIYFFGSLDSDTRNGILALIGVLTVPIITFATQFILSQHQSREQALREKRINFYGQVICLFIDMLTAAKDGVKLPQEELAKGLKSINIGMLSYGSHSFIRAWNRFLRVTSDVSAANGPIMQDKEISNENLSMATMERLLIAMRKDLGHKTPSSRYGDLIGVMVNDLDYSKIKEADTYINKHYSKI